jgi:predicted dehydrogenase
MLIRGQRATPLDIAPPVHTILEALKAFVQALRHDADPPISAVDGYHAVEIAEACYESASSKEMVEIESDDADDATPDDWDEY